jgi:hypothetical protein
VRHSPLTMEATAAAVHTMMEEPALKPRVCNTKPLLVSITLPARPAGANTQLARLASRKPAGGSRCRR